MYTLTQAHSSHPETNWNTLLFLLPLVLLACFFWLQRRCQQQMRTVQRQIEVGEEVNTTSGPFGRLVLLNDEIGIIEVAPDMQLRFDRRTIVRRVQRQAECCTGEAAQQPDVTDNTSSTDVNLGKKTDLATKAG